MMLAPVLIFIAGAVFGVLAQIIFSCLCYANDPEPGLFPPTDPEISSCTYSYCHNCRAAFMGDVCPGCAPEPQSDPRD